MTSSKPQFSVIIPTLNEEKYLPKLLGDLEKQTFLDFEVLVVDGESTDKTVAKALDFKTRLPELDVINSKKRNVALQRNLGAKRARGNWLIFMDADDRLPKYFIEGVKYKIALTKADVFTCWCEADKADTSDKIVGQYLNLGAEIGKLVEYPVALGAMIGISKKGFEKTEGFNSKLVPLEDGKFVRDAYRKGLKFQIFRDPKYVYSLRRFRKSGMLGTVRNYSKLYLKKLGKIQINQNLEYPMGGEMTMSKVEEPLFKGVQENLRRLTKRPQLRKRLRALLATFENGF